jgi:hypothetical protein
MTLSRTPPAVGAHNERYPFVYLRGGQREVTKARSSGQREVTKAVFRGGQKYTPLKRSSFQRETEIQEEKEKCWSG